MDKHPKSPPPFTLIELLRALQDVADSDAEAVAVLVEMIRSGHVGLLHEPALAA